jgi:hypothetical protein
VRLPGLGRRERGLPEEGVSVRRQSFPPPPCLTRRSGVGVRIGTMLVQTVEALMVKEGIRTMVADTPQLNFPARSFLEKLGFDTPISHVYMSLNMAKSDEARPPRVRGADGRVVKVRQMEVSATESPTEDGFGCLR